MTGERNHCPVCQAALWAPAAETIGTRQCPRCSAELWALQFSEAPAFFVRSPGQALPEFLAALMGITATEMEAALRGADDLDLVELVLDVEETLRQRG